MKKIEVFIISDSVGETGELVAKAALSQFRPNNEEVSIRRFPFTRTERNLRKIIALAEAKGAIVMYTLVKHEMRKMVTKICQEHTVRSVDVLGPTIAMMDALTGENPLEKPGIVHQLDDDYFEKMAAIEFAVKYDDGRDPRGILQADIVLVGVSRTSKTPLSQYLAHKRYKVANVPLVPEVEPPQELYEVDPQKCFGLMISPEKLNFIRKERLIALGLNDDAIYAKHERIQEELVHFHKVVDKIGCQAIDVTNKAVEETANTIIQYLHQYKNQ